MQQILTAQGEGLVRALVRSLCDTCPRRHLRALAGCLYQLLCSPWCGDAALQWLVGALRAHDLPGTQLSMWFACTALSFAAVAVEHTPWLCSHACHVLELSYQDSADAPQVSKLASSRPRTAAVSTALLRGARRCR